MDFKKIIGIITFVTGILLVVCPIFFRNLLLPIIGFSIVCLGVLAIFRGWEIRIISNNIYSNISVIVGMILIVLGLLYLFCVDMISIVEGFEFYIIGILFIILGINWYLSNINHIHDFSSILTLILGVLSMILTVLTLANPVYVPILIGIVLIAEGFSISISY